MEAGKHRGLRRAMAVALLACAMSLALAAQAGAALPRLKAVPDPVNGGRIVDSKGREVLLRGVNVNSLGQYWQGTSVKPTLPLDKRDPGRISRIGWNTVRLIVSWSRVEPRPGRYDEAYLATVAKWVRRLGRHGVYTIIDLHQDAWGATLAAPDDQICASGERAFGWDGAPGWATLDDGQPRCFNGSREINPAVKAAWNNFFANSPAADGVGIQTHYVRMLRRIARTFAKNSAVAGIDVMNEPNTLDANQTELLGPFYARALKSIRQGERAGRGFRHLFFFEPGVLWDILGSGPPPAFKHDSQIVYSPHLYKGSIGVTGPPDQASFVTAREEAKAFGGAPVVTGEWGGAPARATGGPDDYFLVHQSMQDEFGYGAMLWTWKQSCGDPHAATHDPEAATPLPPWNVFRMDCSGGGNRIIGIDKPLVRDLRRGYVRRAPGRLASMAWDPAGMTLVASGRGATRKQGRLEAFIPLWPNGVRASRRKGLSRIKITRIGAGSIVSFRAAPGRWKLTLRPR